MEGLCTVQFCILHFEGNMDQLACAQKSAPWRAEAPQPRQLERNLSSQQHLAEEKTQYGLYWDTWKKLPERKWMSLWTEGMGRAFPRFSVILWFCDMFVVHPRRTAQCRQLKQGIRDKAVWGTSICLMALEAGRCALRTPAEVVSGEGPLLIGCGSSSPGTLMWQRTETASSLPLFIKTPVP